jgi:charged multivesicular body protein 4
MGTASSSIPDTAAHASETTGEPGLRLSADTDDYANTNTNTSEPTTTTRAVVPFRESHLFFSSANLQTVVTALRDAAGWVAQSIGSLKYAFGSQYSAYDKYDKDKVTEAITKLQGTLSFLDSKIEGMCHRVGKYTCEAKRQYFAHNKTAAMHQLRLKKMYEREVSKMDSLKFNIESNILHMESVGVMMETVSTIKETSHQFQIVSRHVDITKLEDSIEEMFEQRDASKDIESILNDMHDSHDYDDDELLQELERLVAVPTATATAAAADADADHNDSPPPSAEVSPPQLIDVLEMPDAPTNAIFVSTPFDDTPVDHLRVVNGA